MAALSAGTFTKIFLIQLFYAPTLAHIYTHIEKNSRGKPREKCTMHAFTEWFAVSNDKRTEYGLVIFSFNKNYKNTDRDHFRQNSFSAPKGWRRIMGIINGKYFYINILINFINGGI